MMAGKNLLEAVSTAIQNFEEQFPELGEINYEASLSGSVVKVILKRRDSVRSELIDELKKALGNEASCIIVFDKNIDSIVLYFHIKKKQAMDDFKIKVWKNGLEVFECVFSGKVKSSSTVTLDEDSVCFKIRSLEVVDEREFVSLLQWVLEEVEMRLIEEKGEEK